MNRLMHLNILLSLIGILCNNPTIAQEKSIRQDSVSKDSLKEGNKLVYFPLVFYLPETSVGFGGAAAYTYRWENQTNSANPSQFQFVGTYTLEKQILLYLPYQLYLGDNDYYIFGELGFYKYFYRYYGIGPESDILNEESYRADYPRLTLNAAKQFIPNWFGGLSFWYDDFDMRGFDEGGELDKRITIGTAGGAVMGLGFRVIHDTRKNIFSPTKGFYGDFAYRYHSDTWGSAYNFSSVDITASKYVPINEGSILALNGVTRITSGDVPFYHLALHGGPKYGRGYELGRFRDRIMLIFNAEWRQQIKGRFSIVAFVNYGGVAQRFGEIDIATFIPAAGLGLRFALDKVNKINVRLDYGIGKNSSQFYITVGEAF